MKSLSVDGCPDLDTAIFIARGSVIIFSPVITNLQIFGYLAKWGRWRMRWSSIRWAAWTSYPLSSANPWSFSSPEGLSCFASCFAPTLPLFFRTVDFCTLPPGNPRPYEKPPLWSPSVVLMVSASSHMGSVLTFVELWSLSTPPTESRNLTFKAPFFYFLFHYCLKRAFWGIQGRFVWINLQF